MADFDDSVLLELIGWNDYDFDSTPITPVSGGSVATFLTIDVPLGTPPAMYPLTVIGTSETQNHTALTTLRITSNPDFGLSVYPDILTINKSSAGTYNVTIASLNGFDLPVQLSLSSMSSAFTGSFYQNPVTTLPNQIKFSTLTIIVPDSAIEGTYEFYVDANSSTTMPRSYKVNLIVTETTSPEPNGPEPTTPGPPFPLPLPSNCVIATATYGSELSPEVSFLRIFRDQTVMSTFAGKQFMTMFNAWYYSFSPPVARTISDNTVVKPIMKAILYPLIGTLHVAAKTNSALSIFGPELAMVAAGLVASCLIGVAYLAPLSLVTLFAFRRYRRIRISSYPLYILAGLVLSSGTLLMIGELMTMPALVMFSVAMLVVTTLALSGIALTRFVAQSLKF